MRLTLIAMLFAGCSRPDAGRSVDAAPTAEIADAPPDTAPAGPDAGPDAIRVRVVDRGTPIVGALVLFHDPTGALIARATTDADGDALGDVPDGSMVTVFAPGSIARLPWLRTIRAAARGDVLVFGQLHPQLHGTFTTATVPAHPAPPPQFAYEVATTCGAGDTQSGSGNPTTVELFDAFQYDRALCATPSRGTAMAILMSTENGGNDVVGYIEQQDVELVAGTPITISGTWSPAVNQKVAVTGVPPDADLAIRKTWYRNGAAYFGMGRTFRSSTESYPGPLGGEAWRALFSLVSRTAPGPSQFWYRWLTDPLDLGDDVDSSRLPWISDAVVDFGPRTQISWTTDAVPTYSFTRVRVDLQGDHNSVLAEWTTYLPPLAQAAASITLPELPDDLAAQWTGLSPLAAIATVEIDRTVALSYSALRGRLFSDPLTELELAQTSVSRWPWWDSLP